jgi:hypothetical protein
MQERSAAAERPQVCGRLERASTTIELAGSADLME